VNLAERGPANIYLANPEKFFNFIAHSNGQLALRDYVEDNLRVWRKEQ